MSHRVTQVFVALLSIACATSGPVVEPVPRPSNGTSVPPSSVLTSPQTWTLTADYQPRTYLSIATTIFELHSDTAFTRDTVTVSTDFTISVTPEGGLTRLTGTINRMSITAGNKIGQPAQLPLAPFPFTARIENRILILDSAGGEPVMAPVSCNNVTLATLTLLQRNVIAVPATPTLGMTWRDSAVVSGCSGSIPVSLSVVRTYKIAREVSYQGQLVLLIERTDSTRATGEGSEEQHRIIITSQGSGSAQLYIDRTTGLLAGTEGEQKADVSVTASGRTQRFTQTVSEKTTPRRNH